MRKINIDTAVDKQGSISETARKQIRNFLVLSANKNVEFRIEVVDKPAQYAHRFYRGYLLPDITHAAGETDRDKMHFELKYEYLFAKCDDINSIDGRYFRNGYYAFRRGTKLLYQHLQGLALLVDDDDKLLGYIPSLATVTMDEMMEYLGKLEIRLTDDLGGHLGCSKSSRLDDVTFQQHQEHVLEMRGKIWKS